MHKSTLLAAIALGAALPAQSNAVNGLDGRLTEISSLTVLGSTSTTIGCAARNDMCNVGSVNIPWHAAMAENHPKFGFMVARELNGRFEQISDRSFCKHAFLTINGSGVCGPCQGGSGSSMGLNCTDVYGVGNNGDRFWLGPADEIDPWLGTWNHVGSYFDQGFPNVGAPGNMNGVRSPINPTNSVMNRVTIKKSDLADPTASYYYMIHLIHEGEPVGNRDDNLMTKSVGFAPSGNSYTTVPDADSPFHGSILEGWDGAFVAQGRNGNDDGTFHVAVKVVETTPGNFRYEYAMHNADNSRGGASFRVPMCPTAAPTNFFFRDIDDNALNQWSATVVGNEIQFNAPANNPLDWNTIYNFGFDSPASPGAGGLMLAQARLGPGAATLTIGSRLPIGGLSQVPQLTDLGPGCGTPPTTLSTTGLPTVPNPSMFLIVQSAPTVPIITHYSFDTANHPIAVGCTQYLDPNSTFVMRFEVATGSGVTLLPLPIPAGMPPFSVNFQVAQLMPGGPILGNFGLSNGLQLASVQVGGCP